MTMLTSCAACGTAFRVTAEQLMAHQGKVRCGACNTVFSALEHLVHAPPDAPSTSPTGSADHPAASVAGSAGVSVARLAGPETTTARLVLGAAPVPPQVPPQVPPPVLDEDRTVPLENLQSSASAGDAAPDDTALAAAASLDGMPEPAPQEAQDAQAAPAAQAAQDAGSPAVTPTAQRSQFAWWSATGALVAVCALLLQGAYFYRNELATRYPEAKPALVALCQQLACSFDTPRDAQAITIESHDLQAEPANKNVLVLVALLRNRAAFAQDAPHLELTLTDAQDAALARRVFVPRDYVAATQMASNSELPVRIMLDTSQIKAAGYRLYAFYP